MEKVDLATSTTTIATISQDPPIIATGPKTQISKESGTGTEVAAEAQATAPDLIVTTRAEIKTLANSSSGPSLNFFKIRMKCKRTFMNRTHQKAKSGQSKGINQR